MGRQQGVLPPHVSINAARQLYKPFMEERGNFHDLYRRIQRAYRIHIPAITAARTRSRKYKREISLEYLTDEKHYPLGTAGKDFRAPEPDEEYIIQICGDTLILNNGLLVEALSRLPVWKQEMVYLSYFRRIPQREIGRRYGRSRSAAGYHIRKAIRQLHKEMEGMTHEE